MDVYTYFQLFFLLIQLCHLRANYILMATCALYVDMLSVPLKGGTNVYFAEPQMQIFFFLWIL